ncbi:hypothetical protein DIPPA_16645 [Diplonema papillatum]|nr:hypothetical protein DIPPA_16645 [Diplonema papillatum]
MQGRVLVLLLGVCLSVAEAQILDRFENASTEFVASARSVSFVYTPGASWRARSSGHVKISRASRVSIQLVRMWHAYTPDVSKPMPPLTVSVAHRRPVDEAACRNRTRCVYTEDTIEYLNVTGDGTTDRSDLTDLPVLTVSDPAAGAFVDWYVVLRAPVGYSISCEFRVSSTEPDPVALLPTPLPVRAAGRWAVVPGAVFPPRGSRIEKKSFLFNPGFMPEMDAAVDGFGGASPAVPPVRLFSTGSGFSVTVTDVSSEWVNAKYRPGTVSVALGKRPATPPGESVAGRHSETEAGDAVPAAFVDSILAHVYKAPPSSLSPGTVCCVCLDGPEPAKAAAALPYGTSESTYVQNALQRDAEGLALLEKRLLDLEAGLARREAEVEAAEREIGAAQKRAREQDEAEKEAKRPRGGEELPGEGGVPLMPAELMPGLPRARAEEIFLAFDEQDPGFWAGLGPTLQRELGSLEDEREVLALLDGAAVAGQDVGDDDDDDDFAFLDPERWRTMQPTASNMRGFEDAVRRLDRFKGNQQLQDRRDDVTERVRDLVRLRRGESGPPKRMWILRLGGLFHSYEEQNAEYETRDPSAALVMRDVLRVELLPERVRQARRRFTAQFKAAPKGGFAAWERRVAVFEGGATSKKTTAQRASIVASLTRFTAVAGLQAAPPALRIKAFATAMLGKGMTQEQLEAYVARVPGQRGRPRTGEMRTASVGKYVEVLGAKLGVPSGDLAAMKKAILKARLERREVPAHAPPITLEQQRTLVEGLVRGGDEQVTVAACLAWAGALRMADLRALAPTDVVIVGPGLLRVSWWTTKEASLRMRESEVTYRVPLGVALRVSRWVQRGARFTEATTRKLLREARKLFPVCAEHSWKRGALQHLARSGAGWEDLLLMARHQSKDTLKRYLWGCLTPDSVRTARASLLLHTPVSGDLMACSR